LALTPLDEAQSFVLAACGPLRPTEVPLADSLGCVLADALVATEAVPAHDNTAMDGYAVRAADVAGASDGAPVRLRVVDTLYAGRAPDRAVGRGEAVRIMTGALLPDGADAVVMVERTSRVGDGSEVDISAAVEVGTHVRPAGDDVRPGDTVLEAGTTITPAALGVLAMLGVDPVMVTPRPVVGVLSTGDELVAGSGALEPGQLRDSNRPMLLSLVGTSGFDAVDLGCIPDDDGAITAALESGAASCDAVITSGGVSMGDVDLVKVVLDRLGDMRWMQVAIKPAKPLAFGTVMRSGGFGRPIPVFGLPGNPVSSAVSFELFARPALRKMMGYGSDHLGRPRVRAIADTDLRRHADGKVHFARVSCRYGSDGLYHVASAGGQGSHQLSALARADGLAVLPDGEGVRPGESVDVLLLT
jgi:molybdopterin molybdotransferase